MASGRSPAASRLLNSCFRAASYDFFPAAFRCSYAIRSFSYCAEYGARSFVRSSGEIAPLASSFIVSDHRSP
jgi:hypothetical protein